MNDFWEKVLDFTAGLTKQVGQKLLADFSLANYTLPVSVIPEREAEVFAIEKNDGSLVTASDQWADRTIREAIAMEFPLHGILSEEGERFFPFGNWCWVIDPLDGTTNFAHGIPIWGISIALLYQGTPVFGYIYLPTLDHAYYGFHYGQHQLIGPSGAFLNGKTITPSPDQPNSNHFFNLCSRSISLAPNLKPAKIRLFGMASYNFVLVGGGMCLAGVEATPKIWDIAAAWVIVNAAGGLWLPIGETDPIFPLEVGIDYSHKSYPTLVVANQDLVKVYEP